MAKAPLWLGAKSFFLKTSSRYLKAEKKRLVWMLLALLGLSFGCKRGTIWSTADEVRIGKQVSAEIEKEYRLDPDPAHQARVREIGQRLVAVAGKKEYEYTFKVLDRKEINAVSLPGGPIYVFRGLLEMVGSDEDMLAGVIGHELGHINARHLAKQYTKGFWLDLAVMLGTKGRTQDYASIASALLQLHYSRKDEYEADRLGIEYAYQAGYDPEGIIRFFEKLREKERGGEKGLLANLRTHPLTENRIWRAKEHCAQVTGRTLPQPSKGGSK